MPNSYLTFIAISLLFGAISASTSIIPLISQEEISLLMGMKTRQPFVLIFCPNDLVCEKGQKELNLASFLL